MEILLGIRGNRTVTWKLVAFQTAILVSAAVVLSVGPGQTVFGKPALGRTWPAAQRVSMDRIDHSEYDQLLQTYVDKDGYVDYAAWQRSSADRKRLLHYLGNLSRADRKIACSQRAELAFWINAYNAVTIEGILQEYPTSSIRNHTARVFGYNIWKELPLKVGGREFSLETIEHSILRKMREPRIHFAIVCASVGCPRLLNEAYTPQRVDAQLAANARDFFSRPGNFRVDPARRAIYVSSILDWFAADFGDSQQAQWKYLEPYLPKSAQAIATNPATSVHYLDYNWSLNDQAKRIARRP